MIKHLTAILGLDKSGFDAGMAAAGKQIDKFGSGLKSQLAGAFGATAFIALGKQAVDFADKIQDISEQLDVGADVLQGYDYAARRSGSSLESFASALKKIGVARREALSGKGKEFVESFENLGVSVDDLKSKRLEELLEIISDRFRQAGDNQSLLADGVKILGKSAQETFGAMKSGLSGLRKEAEEKGLIISSEQIANLANFKDQWGDVGSFVKGAFSEVIGVIAIAQNDVVKFVSEVGKIISVVAKIVPGKGHLGIREIAQELQLLKNSRTQGKGVFGSDAIDGQGGLPEKDIGSKKREADYQAALKAAKVHMAIQDRIVKINEDSEDIAEKNRIAGLSTEERLVELAEEREKIFQRIAATEEERAQKQLDLAKNEADIIGLSKDPAKKADGAFKINETAMGRIGAFTGAAAAASLPPGQAQQLQQLQKIHDALVIKGIIVKDSR